MSCKDVTVWNTTACNWMHYSMVEELAHFMFPLVPYDYRNHHMSRQHLYEAEDTWTLEVDASTSNELVPTGGCEGQYLSIRIDACWDTLLSPNHFLLSLILPIIKPDKAVKLKLRWKAFKIKQCIHNMEMYFPISRK